MNKTFCNSIILILSSLLLSSCAAIATPYQPYTLEGVRLGGYKDRLIAGTTNTYFLSFAGNGATKIETAIEYWERRADELCPNGYKPRYIEAEIPNLTIDGEYHHYVDAFAIIPIRTKSKAPLVNGEITCI